LRAGFGDYRVKCDEGAGSVDVALNDVAAEGTAGGGGQLKIYL
jgi:hypothetical protein